MSHLFSSKFPSFFYYTPELLALLKLKLILRLIVTMTPEEWIQRYARAWETANSDEIVDLFTADAIYQSNVFREPYLGKESIRQYWQRVAGSQRNVKVRMGRPIIAQDRVAVEWWTTMIDPNDGEITLPGCLLLRFRSDGRCEDLWEYWEIKSGIHEPPSGWGI